MTNTPEINVEVLVEAALAAGAILPGLQAGVGVAQKSDGSPVTMADTAAEAIILEYLQRAAPHIPVVGEESGDSTEGALPDQFFLVDPLDGTKEFIKGRADYTVNIALIKNGDPVAGVVFAPARGQAFSGDRDSGAQTASLGEFTLDAWRSEAIEARVRPVEMSAISAVASRSHRTLETDEMLEKVGAVDIVSAGSSLKFCLLAIGEADFYPRLGRTMEWDTAAGHAVLWAAGGLVTGLDGAPLQYGKIHQTNEEDFANPYFIAATSQALINRAIV